MDINIATFRSSITTSRRRAPIGIANVHPAPLPTEADCITDRSPRLFTPARTDGRRRRRTHAYTNDHHGLPSQISQSCERGRDSPLTSEPFFCRQTDQAFCETWIDHKKRDSLFA